MNPDDIIGTANYIALARHCIGLDHKKPYHRHGKTFYLPYRNYYAAGRAHEEWELMVSAEYAECDTERFIYSLTRAGLDWLGRQLDMTIYDEED
jgi:hypothetical protein